VSLARFGASGRSSTLSVQAAASHGYRIHYAFSIQVFQI